MRPHVQPRGRSAARRERIGKAAYYRMAELFFTDQAQMQTTLGSPEGQATIADLSNFATGGVTTIIGTNEI